MSELHPDDPEALLAQSNWLRRLARGLVRDESAAEDLVQDTWIAALRAKPADLRAWMSVVARNFARRERRDAGLRAAHEPRGAREERVEGPDEIAQRVELQRELASALLALEEPFRTALVLRYLDGLSSIQVAERLGVSHDAARQRISRGLAKLRERLDREHRGGRAGWMGALLPFAPAPKTSITGGLLLMGTKTKIACAVLAATLGLWLWKGVLAPAALEPDPAAQGTPALAADTDPLPNDEKPLDAAAGDARSAVAVPLHADPAAAGEPSNLLRGLVLDPADRPVEGARIVANCAINFDYQTLDLAIASRSERVGETRSNAEGRFELRLDAARSHQISVDKPGFAQATFGRRRPGEMLTVHLKFGAGLEGHVTVGDARAPAVQAKVRCFLRGNDASDGARFEQTTETDERGFYRFDTLPPGILFLEVSAVNGPASDWTEVHPEAGKTITRDVHLSAKAWVTGIVLDALTRAPIAGAELGTIWVLRHTVASGADGRFALPVDGGNAGEVYVRAAGYGFRGFPLPESALEVGLEGLEIVLEPARKLRGRVLDARGAPVAGAYVAACGSEYGQQQKHDWVSSLSNAEGRFEIADLRPDLRHSLFVRAKGFGTVVYELPQNELDVPIVELSDVVLQPAGSISGILVDDQGHPLPDLRLELSGANADRGRWATRESWLLDSYVAEREGRTDDRGRFTFDELAAGKYSVVLRRDSHQVTGSEKVVLAEGERKTGVRIVVASGVALEGRVHDRAGNPVSAVMISIEPTAEGLSDCDVQAGEGGRFRAAGIKPGAYRIQLWPGRADPEHPEQRFYVHTTFENVQADGKELDLVIEEGVWLTGVVVEADGTPAAGVQVCARLSGAEYGETGWTDAQGKFRIGVEHDKGFVLEAKRGLGGAAGGRRQSLEADESRWGKLPQVFGGDEDVRVVMPAK